MASDHSEYYYKIYSSQKGGDFPVFKGARYHQYGSGFGDILRGILRFVMPVLTRGAATFLGDVVQKRDQGSTWGDAAKSAIKPTAMSVLNEATNQTAQRGNGKKRKRKRKRSKKHNQEGGRVYKGKKHKAKKQKISFKELINKYPNYNF